MDELKEKSARAHLLNYQDAFAFPVEDPDFQYLNEYIGNVVDKKNASMTAREKYEESLRMLAAAKRSYDEVYKAYASAQAVLMLAQDEYDKFLAEEEAAKKIEEKEAETGIITRNVDSLSTYTVSVADVPVTGDPHSVLWVEILFGSMLLAGLTIKKKKMVNTVSRNE